MFIFIYDDNLVSLIGDFMAQRSKKTKQKGVNLNMRPRNYTAVIKVVGVGGKYRCSKFTWIKSWR